MAPKATKKDLNEPDKLQTLFTQFLGFIAGHKKTLSLVAGVALLILLLGTGWYFYQLDYEKSAGKLYAKAFENALAGKASPADLIKLYQDVAVQYPSSHAALLSHFQLGNLHYALTDIDASMKAYEEFLRKSSEDSDLTTLAYSSLGYCYEAKGDLKNALAHFEKAEKTKAGENFASMNYRNMARIYEALKEPQKALEYYQKALGKTSDPFVERLIKRKIATLG